MLWVTSAKAIEVSDFTTRVSLLCVVWWCVPRGPYMHHIICDMRAPWRMNYIDWWCYGRYVSIICHESDDCCMYTRSITELCHKMLMELEHIFILRNTPCNVSYRTSCMFLFNFHRDTSPLCHERMKFDIYIRHDIMWAFSVLWSLVTCNTLCPTKPGPGVRIRAHRVGPCARTWAMFGEVLHIQPYLE